MNQNPSSYKRGIWIILKSTLISKRQFLHILKTTTLILRQLEFSHTNNIRNVSLGSSEEDVKIILLNDSFVAPSGRYRCTCFYEKLPRYMLSYFKLAGATIKKKTERNFKRKNISKLLKLTEYSQAHAYILTKRSLNKIHLSILFPNQRHKTSEFFKQKTTWKKSVSNI